MEIKFTVTGIDKNGGHQVFTLHAIQDDKFRLILLGDSQKKWQAAAGDFFAAMVNLRIQLEAVELRLLIKGAALNIAVSGMSRQMSGGSQAYTLEIGKPAVRESLVNIFDPANEKEIATVAEQKQYYADWLKSLG